MANTSVVYTGDAVVTNFTVPFPFISRDHVKVYVNLQEVLSPTWWTWVSDSQISFRVAPADGDSVRISRVTPGDNRLVDFQNGAVLTEADLDLSANQNFYLAQEALENYAALVNGELIRIGSSAGVIEVEPDAIIAGLVETMLEDANAANLQARITDIDTNAEAIIDLQNGLQVQINTLAQGVAANVYIQTTPPVPGVGGIPDPIADGSRWYDSDDNNAPYIYDSGTLSWVSIEDPRIGQAAADITVLQTNVGDNAAAVVAESVARSNADSAFASTLALIGAENGAQTAFIIDSNTVKIDSDVGDTLANRFSQLTAEDDDQQAQITAEQTARVNADGVLTADLALIGAKNAGSTAFILDSNTVKIDSDGGNTFAQKFTALEAADSDNSASITTISTVTIPGVQADADAAQADATTGIANAATADGKAVAAQADADTALAKYGVTLDVNDYITGFAQNNDGKTGTFTILADKFAIVQPGTFAQKIYWNGSKLQIDGDLMVSGSINGGQALSTTLADRINQNHINVTTLSAIAADMGTVTAGTITLDGTGYIRSGANSFADASNAGWWLGRESSVSKFSIGNFGTGQYLKWDGSTLTVKGSLFVGEYTASETVLMSADTERVQTTEFAWLQVKAFTSDRAGSVRIKAEVKTSGGSPTVYPQWRVLLEGVEIDREFILASGFTSDTIDVPGVGVDDQITVEIVGGQPGVDAHIRNVDFCATVVIPADGGTVDQN